MNEIIAGRASEAKALSNRYLNAQPRRTAHSADCDRVWAGGEGAHLIDANGHRYLDLLGGHGAFAIGRNHPEAIAAVEDALAARTGNLPIGAQLLDGVLAEQMLARAPASVGAMLSADSGAAAVAQALEVARAATGRRRTLHAGRAATPFGDLDALERELCRGDVAALVIEPIDGGDVHLPPFGYLEAAQSLCTATGTLFVCDETRTGIGRTGRLLALEHWRLQPDMVCLSNALAGGLLPIGAVLVSRTAFDRARHAIRHSPTVAGNDLAAAAALGTLRTLERDDLLAHGARMGELLLALTRRLVGRYEVVRDVRGLGLMWGIELGPPAGNGRWSMWSAIERAQPGIFAQSVAAPLFHEHRIFCRVGGRRSNVIKALPALVIEEREIRRFAAALEEVIADAEHASRAMLRLGWRAARRFGRERRASIGPPRRSTVQVTRDEAPLKTY